MRLSKFIPVILLTIVILFFFYPVSLFGKVPIPADTIIGLYHPFRDFYAKDYPRGIPFKNSLITDPVRQQFPWRSYAISMEQYGTLPLWNPYNFAGTPLLANFQSAVLYPLNLFLLLPNFTIWWSVLIILQPLLAGIFMYLFLKELKLNIFSCFLGGIVYAFCGFSIAWLEWGTIGHVMLWLPLSLLCIDRIFNLKVQQKKQKLLWPLVFIFSISSAFLAGHLQTFFYLYILVFAYFFSRWFQKGRQKKILGIFLIINFCFLILTAVQWLPTLQFIIQSARDVDHVSFQQAGWFLPVQNLIQFFAPDFFGNPATLNYWGVWNYGEFIGYIGIFPLIMALYALFYRFDKKTIFFGSIFFLSLIFALPTWFAKIPFELNIPFLSTAQPTRLIFLTDFSLAVLAACGLDFYMRAKKKNKIIYPLLFVLFVYAILWIFVYIFPNLRLDVLKENINIAKHNLYFPTVVFFIILIIVLLSHFIKVKKLYYVFIVFLIFISVFDLFRFAYKFTPFTDPDYLYPDTFSVYLLRKLTGYSRYMTTDARLIPPNFSIMFYTQSIDGYDPLYLKRYGELIAAMERNSPDINPPFGFNRIINPHNYSSRIADLLGVKYVLSLTDLSSPKLKKVFHEGETRMYENKDAFDRAFFVNRIIASESKQQSINAIFDRGVNLKQTGVVEGWDQKINTFEGSEGTADIIEYKSNDVIINTKNKKAGFLILTDSYYNTWHAKICQEDHNNCQEVKIYLTDYNFRGVLVPPGDHSVIFYNTLL